VTLIYQGDPMNSKELSDKLEKVLNEVLPEVEGHSDGDLLIDWIVVAYVTNPDKEEESGYPMLYSNGDMPMYRARGLLSTGLNALNNTVY
jgi:hypothetical protein